MIFLSVTPRVFRKELKTQTDLQLEIFRSLFLQVTFHRFLSYVFNPNEGIKWREELGMLEMEILIIIVIPNREAHWYETLISSISPWIVLSLGFYSLFYFFVQWVNVRIYLRNKRLKQTHSGSYLKHRKIIFWTFIS